MTAALQKTALLSRAGVPELGARELGFLKEPKSYFQTLVEPEPLKLLAAPAPILL